MALTLRAGKGRFARQTKAIRRHAEAVEATVWDNVDKHVAAKVRAYAQEMRRGLRETSERFVAVLMKQQKELAQVAAGGKLRRGQNMGGGGG
jgi:CHASE3 domain sensor protein